MISSSWVTCASSSATRSFENRSRISSGYWGRVSASFTATTASTYGSAAELRDELLRLLGGEAHEQLGVLEREGGLPREGAVRGLFGEEVLHAREGDRIRHRVPSGFGTGQRCTGVATSCFGLPPSRNSMR